MNTTYPDAQYRAFNFLHELQKYVGTHLPFPEDLPPEKTIEIHIAVKAGDLLSAMEILSGGRYK